MRIYHDSTVQTVLYVKLRLFSQTKTTKNKFEAISLHCLLNKSWSSNVCVPKCKFAFNMTTNSGEVLIIKASWMNFFLLIHVSHRQFQLLTGLKVAFTLTLINQCSMDTICAVCLLCVQIAYVSDRNST